MKYICLLQEGYKNLPEHLEYARACGYNAIATPINCMDMPYISYPDLLLKADEWNDNVILTLTDTINCDSKDAIVRKHSEEMLMRDISWAHHLQFDGFVMVHLKSQNNTNLARFISNNMKGTVLVKVPLYNAKKLQAVWRRDVGESDLDRLKKEDTWQWWNSFRWFADFHPKIKVVLEVNETDLPSLEVVRRWLGEPIEAIILPSSIFIYNSDNFPVLPKAWKKVLSHFMSLRINFIISSSINENNLESYSKYLFSFADKHSDKYTMDDFEDIIEVPLQPLHDNLDAYTYEVFEKDPVKYHLYQYAIEEALKDLVPEEEKKGKLTIIMVLGAGRGPLVRSALNAAEKTERKVRIYIIEKNPNAIRTLEALTRKLWHNKDVHIFSKDMREFSPPEKADILVSELLGSFGDNELSPECLDCAQQLLKPGGVSIPGKSTSYINPIMSSTVYNNLRNAATSGTYRTFAESGAVVLLKNIYNIAMPQVLFDFEHPNIEEPIDNSRYKVLRFDVTMDCVLNGFAGYFEAVLYKDVKLSITPETHTPGLVSWFPMYFPIMLPMKLKKGQVIEIHFWRRVSPQQIWYEWSLTSPAVTHVHNLGGRSYPIYC